MMERLVAPRQKQNRDGREGRRLSGKGLLGLWLVGALAAAGPAAAAEPPVIAVYAPGKLPKADYPERTEKFAGETRVRNVSEPTLTAFLPDPAKATGAAVIVAPGGSFVMLSWESEGVWVAKRLAEAGVAAFVLKYRLDRTPADTGEFIKAFTAKMTKVSQEAAAGGPSKLPGPFGAEPLAAADGAEAVRLVRRRAAEWGVDPKRVGFLGFSAGGFTASNVATGETSGRPDFVGVIYAGLRNPVPSDAPPLFAATAADDTLLKDAAIPMYQAWRAAGRSAELHLYERGGHGFGLVPKGSSSDHWFDEFLWWMQSRGVLAKAAK